MQTRRFQLSAAFPHEKHLLCSHGPSSELLSCNACGKVSKGQFRRALDQAGLTAPARGAPVSDLLTQREVEILSRRYEVKAEGNGSVTAQGIGVNYWKLCEQIEKVHVVHGNAGFIGLLCYLVGGDRRVLIAHRYASRYSKINHRLKAEVKGQLSAQANLASD